MKVSIIAAMSDGNVIGRSSDNAIPWHIPEDFAHFKETTKGGVVIMGRNTWESLPKKPLPKRENIVLYNMDKGFLSDGEHYGCHDLTIALEGLCKEHLKAENVYVIGGRRVYEEAMAVADELIITHIERYYEGDVLFPLIDHAIWEMYAQKSLTPYAAVRYYKRRQ